MGNEEAKKARVLEPEAKILVRAENIGKRFGKFRALEDVSFQMRQGEVLGFLGPNGAGKTTAMRTLVGYFPPTEGKVWIDEQDLYKNPQKVKQKIGYLPEWVSLYPDMRVVEFLRFVAAAKGVSRRNRTQDIEEKLNRCGLSEARNKLIRVLSKGHRQRVGLAQALLGDPEVLILDEPTSGLDPKQIIEIRGLIRELGRDRALIVSTHILPEVSMVCDRVLILNRGRVVASGTPDELEHGLQSGREISLTIGDRHRKEEMMGLFQQLSGVEEVKNVKETGDHVTLLLIITKGVEIRPLIHKLLVEHQIPLLEMTSGRMSLEEIFLKLVVNENDSPG